MYKCRGRLLLVLNWSLRWWRSCWWRMGEMWCWVQLWWYTNIYNIIDSSSEKLFANVKHVSFKWSNLCLGFIFEARETECVDGKKDDSRGKYLPTLEDCAANCKGYAGMFAWAFTADRFKNGGYLCYCETSPGIKTCTETDSERYNLYKFT